MECVSDSRSGIESVSEAGGVTRRGLFRRAERGMVSIVLKVFCRSWKDAARVQNAEWVSCVEDRVVAVGGWGVARAVPSVLAVSRWCRSRGSG